MVSHVSVYMDKFLDIYGKSSKFHIYICRNDFEAGVASTSESEECFDWCSNTLHLLNRVCLDMCW